MWLPVALVCLAALALLSTVWKAAGEDILLLLISALETAQRLGPLRGGLLICAMQVVGFCLCIPTSVLSVAAGCAYGFWPGLGVAATGYAAGCLLPFFISRHVLHAYVLARVRRHRIALGLMLAVEDHPFSMVLLLRLSPVLPSPVNCYMLGLTRIGLGTYLAATLLGAAPNWVFCVYLGSMLSAVRDVIRGDRAAMPWPLLALGLVATAAVLGLASSVASRKLRELAPREVDADSDVGRAAPAASAPSADSDIGSPSKSRGAGSWTGRLRVMTRGGSPADASTPGGAVRQESVAEGKARAGSLGRRSPSLSHMKEEA